MTECSCDLEAKGQRDASLGDRKVERETWNPSEQHALSPGQQPPSFRGSPASRYRGGCSQALPPSARSTVEVEFVQNKVFCLNISAPQCRTHREAVGEDGRPAVWGAPADRPTATSPGKRSPPTLRPRVRGVGLGGLPRGFPLPGLPLKSCRFECGPCTNQASRGGRGHREVGLVEGTQR